MVNLRSNAATVGVTTLVLAVFACPAFARPTLKGPLTGVLQFDPDTGSAVFEGSGHLTLMGRVAVYGEFIFVPGEEPNSADGVGVAAFLGANGDVLVANVLWTIDADGNGDLEFRWPGEIAFSDGTTIESTGRFVELPFAGLRGTSTSDGFGEGRLTRITMTGEIIDPDPLD
jgi:hypothetical protein